MLQRATSDSSTPSVRRWRGLGGSALRKFQSIGSSKDDKSLAPKSYTTTETDSSDRFSQLRPTETNGSHATYESAETNHRELQALVQRMRSAPSGPNHVDAAYKEFTKIKDRCSNLCYAILQDDIRPVRNPSYTGENSNAPRDSVESPRSPGALHDQRSSFSGRSFGDALPGTGVKGVLVGEPGLGVIRDWKNALETLAETFKTSLVDTYRNYERDATQEMVDLLFNSKKFRREAVNRMRNASVTRVMSADPHFFPRYEIRFRNYEKVKQELGDIRHLLQSGESGISPARKVEEFPIAPRGDAVLEFANIHPGSNGSDSVFRFRVSSYMLAETSPIFARMFARQVSSSLHLHEDGDIMVHLPPPPTKYICKDGTEAKLYRMPQHEVNRFGSLEVLLHAAHMHEEKVPREVSFEQFVAIAECSIKYKSTSPLELTVEHRWLPYWMHKGADKMPDGLLVISYAFGLRSLFARMSKIVLLNLIDERDLQSRGWPQRIKDKIWAVRCAKVEQVYACCASTIHEYIRQPAMLPVMVEGVAEDGRSRSMSATAPTLMLSPSSTPRCPKGSHACDATNLGWMMLMFNELSLLEQLLRPEALSHHAGPAPSASKSLAQILDGLRRIPSPPTPVHGRGVCDPSTMFKASVTDIYNSITGLTLHDVSGKSHGWALSKSQMAEPHNLLSDGLNGMAANDHNYSVVNEFPDSIRVQILSELSDLGDLHSAAMINRAFYNTYRVNELFLIRNILRASRHTVGALKPVPLIISNAEEKVLTKESDELKAKGVGEGADMLTLRSEDDEADLTEDDEDDDIEIDDAISPGLNRFGSVRWTRDAMPDGHVTDEPSSPGPESQSNTPVLPTTQDSPTTPRQSADEAILSTPRQAAIPDPEPEPPMTEDEARRILWPDAVIETISPVAPAPPSDLDVTREKFLASDMPVAEFHEDKTLVLGGEKLLGSDWDWRMGLQKKDERPGTGVSEGSSSKG